MKKVCTNCTDLSLSSKLINNHSIVNSNHIKINTKRDKQSNNIKYKAVTNVSQSFSSHSTNNA